MAANLNFPAGLPSLSPWSGSSMQVLLPLLIFLLAAVLDLGAAEPRQYRESDLVTVADAWTDVARNITIKKFRFQDTSWKDILAYIGNESKAGDIAGKGVAIFIPEEFKDRFAKIADDVWTIQLADGLDLITIFSECPPTDWMYFPVEPRRVAVIPRDALVTDLTTPDKETK